jgi:hypothetical protein
MLNSPNRRARSGDEGSSVREHRLFVTRVFSVRFQTSRRCPIGASVRFAQHAGSRKRCQTEDLFAHVAGSRLSHFRVYGCHPMSVLSSVVNIAVTVVAWQRLVRPCGGSPDIGIRSAAIATCRPGAVR